MPEPLQHLFQGMDKFLLIIDKKNAAASRVNELPGDLQLGCSFFLEFGEKDFKCCSFSKLTRNPDLSAMTFNNAMNSDDRGCLQHQSGHNYARCA